MSQCVCPRGQIRAVLSLQPLMTLYPLHASRLASCRLSHHSWWANPRGELLSQRTRLYLMSSKVMYSGKVLPRSNLDRGYYSLSIWRQEKIYLVLGLSLASEPTRAKKCQFADTLEGVRGSSLSSDENEHLIHANHVKISLMTYLNDLSLCTHLKQSLTPSDKVYIDRHRLPNLKLITCISSIAITRFNTHSQQVSFAYANMTGKVNL